MREEEIRKYAALMRELDLTGLEITEGNKVVRLERAAAVSAVSAAQSAQSVQTSQADVSPSPGGVSSQTDSGIEDGTYSSVCSPIVGVFYAAPAENAEPFVTLGDRVEKGTTLCVIEAMKLMNEVCADESGVIAEICVTNGQVVEFGTELFRIRRQT